LAAVEDDCEFCAIEVVAEDICVTVDDNCEIVCDDCDDTCARDTEAFDIRFVCFLTSLIKILRFSDIFANCPERTPWAEAFAEPVLRLP